MAFRLRDGEEAEENGSEERWKTWYAYPEISGDSPWFNNRSYVDTLNPEAICEFIRVTYEAYERELGEEFGKSVAMIFNDEHQFSFKTQFGYAEARRFLLRKAMRIKLADGVMSTAFDRADCLWQPGEYFWLCS